MNQEEIGNLIKKIRKDHNLTQKELADKLGVTYQAVSKWENGKNIPDIAILKQLSNEFNINIDDLLNGKEVIKPKQKKTLIIMSSIMFILVLSTIAILIIGTKTDLLLKKVTTTSNSFEITGTVAKSNGKTYIYISEINYLEENDTKYDNIKATLYEENDDKNIKIKESDKEESNITLKDYLSKVTFNIDDYKTDCKDITEAKLYIEIETIQDENSTFYKVPLQLEDICPEK